MAIELVVPKLGLSMTEAKIIEWQKNEGDGLQKGDGVLDIETEKVVYTVEAPVSGVLLKVLAKVGDVLPIGAVLAFIGEAGEQIPETAEAAPEMSEGAPASNAAQNADTSAVTAEKGLKIKISPAARKLAQKLNIDYSDIAGSGPNGRIIKEDILAKSEAAASATTGEPVQTELIKEAEVLDQIPYSGIRKTIGSHMSRSWNLAPKVTHHVFVDVTELLELRKKLNSDLPDGRMKVSITDILTKIIAKALKRFPIVNATLEGDTIKLLKNINIGIAVSLEEGLIVPVIKNADKKDVLSIGEEIRHFSQKARTSGLELEEIQGGTFTITNVGAYESVDFFTPIINQPESAILGVGRVKEAPVVINGEVVIRFLMGLSLAFDHRTIDGAPAAEFLSIVIGLIKHPTSAIFGP